MAYQLGQYNKNSSADDDKFMTLVTEGYAVRQQARGDSGTQMASSIFTNECVQVNLSANTNYYFHGKIKRMLSAQTIYIKLIQYTGEATPPGEVEQYIKTITISEGDPHDWVDVEFIFSPAFGDFNAILFELARTSDDYLVGVRYPVILYEELSEINNIITSKIQAGVSLIKMGVQSRPGLLMCINGEEIRSSRTGIFEIRDNILPVTFFSVARAAQETELSIDDMIADINEDWDTATDKSGVHSSCLFGAAKSRTIDNFTLDYIYQE